MKKEIIDLKEVLSSDVNLMHVNYGKSPLSLYLSEQITILKKENQPEKIKENLELLNTFLSGEKTLLKKEASQSLISLFSIDLILKGVAPDHSVEFQKTLFTNPSLTFELMEKMFDYGEEKEGDVFVLNKSLAEISSKVELNEPSIQQTKLLSSGISAVKNRSELDSFFLSNENLPVIINKLEEDDCYFLNKENVSKIKKNAPKIKWRDSNVSFGSLLSLEKNADIRVIKGSSFGEEEMILKTEAKDLYYSENNLKLLTATEKSQYISTGKHYDILKDHVTSHSVVLFNEKEEIEKILFNYSPITKSIEIISHDEKDISVMAACKHLSSIGIKKIELTEKGLKINNKALRSALSETKIKEFKNKRIRQESKRSGSF